MGSKWEVAAHSAVGALMVFKSWRWFSLMVAICSVSPALADSPQPSKVYLGITSRYEPTSQGGGRQLVEKVAPGGPAERAGLREGDQVLGFNGQPHQAASLSALIDSMGWVEAGKPLQLDVLRQDKKIIVSVIPEAASPGQQQALLSWLEDCRKSGGCNDFCAAEEPGPETSLRQAAMRHGRVVMTFVPTPSNGEPALLRSEPAIPGWEFRQDPVFSDGVVLDSIRKLLASRQEITAVYELKGAGTFSLSLKI